MEQSDNEIFESEHSYNLFYGLLDNELKHISEVKNGLKCNCLCPACKKKLVARNGGQKKVHHFAHYQNAECRYGVQTSIHYAAKDILERVKTIRIPEINILIYKKTIDEYPLFVTEEECITVSKERYIKFEEVILEKKLHKYIPDIVLISQGKKLIVEIAVTHFVGRSKLDKIINSKISAIEIDLSKIRNNFKLEELEQIIIHDLDIKKWLHNQYGLELKNKKQLQLLEEFEIQKQKARLEQEEKQRKKESREKWYKSRGFYKEIVYRKTDTGHTFKHVNDCPLKKRKHKGEFYANVDYDCSECKHSRYEREEGKYLVCLFEYHKQKGEID